MAREVILGILFFAVLMLTSFIPDSEAELWELIVDLEMNKSAINSGDSVKISGTVVDHAHQPIEGAEVLVRTGADTTKAFTNSQGMFWANFAEFERVPGTYIINVVALKIFGI